jgi:hypothetical protein
MGVRAAAGVRRLEYAVGGPVGEPTVVNRDAVRRPHAEGSMVAAAPLERNDCAVVVLVAVGAVLPPPRRPSGSAIK